MSSQNNKKCVLITGGSSGIGQACVKACLAEGYTVISTARRERDLLRLKLMGVIPLYLELDDPESIDSIVRFVSKNGMKIDVLFNNAGYGLQTSLEDTSRTALTKQISVNTIGPIQLTNGLLPYIPPGGKLIFNSSILGVCVLPFRGPYAMSKFALEAAADTYRLELESRNIQVHVMQPGPIESEFRKNALNHLKSTINPGHSRLDYSDHIARLERLEGVKGTLSADHVADQFMKLVNGKAGRSRILITRQARLASALKRIMGHGFNAIAKRVQKVRLNKAAIN